MSRADAHVRQATALRDRLRAEGRDRDAEILSGVLRSLAASRATNSALHRDCMKLRQALDASL